MFVSSLKSKWLFSFFIIIILASLFLVLSCKGSTGSTGPSGSPGPIGSPGPTGPAGSPGASTGTVQGNVTNSLTGAGVNGVAITTDPPIQGVNATTDSSGKYSLNLPIGVYSFTFKKDNFASATQSVSVVAGQTITKNMTLNPASPVAVNAGQPQTATPGGNVTLKAVAEPLDGSSVSSYEWTQVSGPKATLQNAKSDTVSVTLPSAAEDKNQLISSMERLDRFMVQPINPHVLESAEVATFKVTAFTTSGNFSNTVDVSVDLPYKVTTGLGNVPVGEPVLLNGKDQSAYDWSLVTANGSKATLQDPTTRNPSFTPDIAGKYTATEKTSGASINIYAGTWAGAITGQDNNGRPLAANCTSCHNGAIAPDKFTDWKQSGHAEIFTQNLNTNAHYGEECFVCHTVGFDKNVNNGGFDDASDYAAFLKSGMLGKPSPNNWQNMLKSFPQAARLANAQCENCHGPNNTVLHPDQQVDAARVSIAADVCGSCHGEPLRHGRFQQWEESGHSNFELAIDEATVENRGATAGHCGRCHSGQGFLAWIEQEDISKQIQGKNGNATVDELKALGLTKDTVEPQTCTVCHDPHNPGTISGEPNNATVRIQDVTKLLPAGFKAEDVGKGALCITCHNTRNGPHNDLFPTNLPTSYSAPHTAAQGDVLLGQTAYLVDVPHRSPHASVKDTCVTCHMEATPPPPLLSYEQSGTNHTFKASNTICKNCHSDTFSGEAFQLSIEERIADLAQQMGRYLLNKMPATVTVQDYTPHTFNNKDYDVKSDKLVIDKSNIVSLLPTEPHGQQGFTIKLKTPLTVTYKPANEQPHSVTVSEVQVQLGDITNGTTAIIPVTDVLVKVGWNYFLLEGDGSKGVHNPEFIDNILHASTDALK